MGYTCDVCGSLEHQHVDSGHSWRSIAAVRAQCDEQRTRADRAEAQCSSLREALIGLVERIHGADLVRCQDGLDEPGAVRAAYDAAKAALADTRSAQLSLGGLQTRLPWRSTYSREFEQGPTWRHFGHALHHIAKALGKLTELLDEVDHNGSEFVRINADALRRDYSKYTADFILLAVRLANAFPGGRLTLERVVADRLMEKFGLTP